MTGTSTADRLAWALDKLDECGKQIEFTLGMVRSIHDCRAHLAALTRPDPSLGGEPEDRPHDPSKRQAEAEALLQRLQDAWDYDATMGDACDMGADWCRAAEHRWKRAKRALEIIRSTDPAALSPPSLGMEGVRDALAAAYEQGCMDTHNSIQAEPELALMPVESAEFGEAASDYAINALASLSTPSGKE